MKVGNVGRRVPLWMVAAMLAGLALRLIFVWRYAHVAGDTLLYGDLARNLIEQHVYGFSQAGMGARATLIRLPGYPLFLAACFKVFGMERYGAVLGVQAVVDLCTCLLLGGIAARVWGEGARKAAVWMGALCPFTANYVAAPLTETLTIFCIALAFYGLARWGEEPRLRWVGVIGFALAYGVLLRPEQGLLAACVVPAIWWMGRGRGGMRAALIVAVMTVLPLVPWTARNWRTFHVVQPLAPRFANDPGEVNPSGFQRWYRTWAVEFASTDEVYWRYDGAEIAIEDLPSRAFDTQTQYEATDALLDDYNVTDTATAGFDARWEALGRERIAARPLRYYVGLPLARVADMTLRPRTEMLPVPLEWWQFKEHKAACWFATGYAGLNLAYFLAAGWGLWRRRVWGAVVWGMVGTVVLRWALLLTLDNSEQRYTVEFFPVLIVLGAGVLAWGRGRDVAGPTLTTMGPS